MPTFVINARCWWPGAVGDLALLDSGTSVVAARTIFGSFIWDWYWKHLSWGSHNMETLSSLLALCEGSPSVTGGFLSQLTSNADLWYFTLARINYWTNTRSAGDLRRHDAHVASLSCQIHIIPSQRAINAVMWSCDIFFDVSLNTLLNKKSSQWWFEVTPR